MESANSRYRVPDGGRLQLLPCKFPDARCRLEGPTGTSQGVNAPASKSQSGASEKSRLARQPCKSRRAALTVLPSEHLAKSHEACYIGFAQYENKVVPSGLGAGFLKAQICSYRAYVVQRRPPPCRSLQSTAP